MSTLVSTLMLATPIAAGVALAGPAVGPASAAAPLDCGTVYAVESGNDPDLWSVNTGTGALTTVDSFDISSTTPNLNALGISPDGDRIYGVAFPNPGSERRIYRLTRSTDTTTYLGAGVSGAQRTHGAYNPSTGIYYYGGFDGGTLRVYGFDPSTSTSLGEVASGSVPTGGTNGDWAFDGQGRLYVVGGDLGDNRISVVNEDLPTTSQTTPQTITATLLATNTAQAAINGMAFGGDGYLYIASGTTIYRINPSTGASDSNATLSAAGSVDLASCAVPSTIEVRKNLPDGRVAAGDQATLTITGGGLSTGNTGTTVGVDPGVQSDPDETAGPVLGLSGTTYTITETGAATGSAYTKAWGCVNQASGASIASGTGASGQFTMPATSGGQGISVLCTFTNAVVPPARDWGDAPNSHGTTNASNGARHSVPGYNATSNTAPLMLGARIDIEADGAASVDSSGDDAAGIDDEDALPALAIAPGATTATATVPVVNSSGSAATLYGWIDANGNGTFQAAEAATVNVPAGATSATLTWTGLTAAVDAAQPAVRLRLTSATLTDAAGTAALDERSQGDAPDGEVEDSSATVATLLPDDCANPFVYTFDAGAGRASLPAGQTTYTYAASGAVQDGSYALVPGIDTTYGSWWHTGPDHTPGDSNGRAMLVNAALAAGKFFAKTFTGLQVGSQYDFSAWITNANNARSTILPNIKFRVVDPVTGTVLSTIDSGDISNKTSLVWERYSLSFTAAQSTVRLELVNNASGGGGNDLALDDIGVAPVCEYGDAPDSYGTQLATGGPVHGKGGPHLGTTVDYEGDGKPTTAAVGDDAAGSDDEDGVAGSIAQSAGHATTVQVSATNNTAAGATLAGWIDLNGNGAFDAAERVMTAVPANSGTATYPLSFPVSSTNADTYARFRVFPGSLANPLPSGAATAGEVEDYGVAGNVPVVSCATDPALFNTAYDGVGGRAAAGTLDRNWQVAVGNATGPASAGPYIPAWVVTRNPAWYAGTFSNASWISYWPDANQVGANVDLYFRYTFRIANEVPLDGFTLPMEFYADNSVPDVWVNGTSQDQFESGLPQTATNQYQYLGFAQANLARTSLRHGFQHGTNTIVVRVASGAPAAGFMAQINAQALCTDRGDAPDSYGTTGVTGASHGLSGYDAAVHTSALMLGSKIDAEANGVPGAAANGDDVAEVDDEDAVGPITVSKGSAPSIDVKVTNATVAPATLAGWVDLDKSGTFDTNERAVATVAPGTVDGTVTMTFAGAVTTTQPTYARFRLFPGVLPNPLPTGQATSGEVEDYAVSTLNPTLTVAKSSNATADSKPGDTITYTVKLTNSGTGAFTAANPARLVDDLAGVLDDATYNGDAATTTGTPTYTAPRISWSGPLAAGASVTLTYTVTLKGGGDGHVRNTAFAQLTPDPGPTPDCSAPSAIPCDSELFELPKLTIAKTANRTQLPAVGQTITYTVTVTNTGLGDFTAGHLATFSDDLSAVLDDTQALTQANITATRGTATFTSPTLDWSGTLPAGHSATITYTLTYTGAGDQQLDNAACIPSAEAADTADTCRTVSVPGSGLRHHKSVDPASGTPVDVGQVLTYTLTFENVGPTDATVDTTDDLSDVLDDAQLVGTPQAGSGLTATVAGNQLEITGSVPAGQTRTVTYQVQVRPWADQDDHLIANVLACEPGEPVGCAPEETSNPVRHLTLTKTSDASVDSLPGDQVTYTVTATNDGTGDWTATDPATLVDDLSDVLDDATYDGTADVTSGATSYAAPRLTWTGALAHGDTVTIEYTVTLAAGGDGNVDNVVWQPGPGGPGPRPDCATATVPCAEHTYDLPKLTIKKTSNRAQLPAAGQKITYTVTVSNAGPGDYTAAHPATFSDDLADVLDDATFDSGSITATAGNASLNGSSLDWSGVLAAGQSVTVSYTLTYQETGNLVVDNHACIPVAEAKDPADACRTVHTPGSGLRHAKSVDPKNGTGVVEGQVLTYTLTFENVGPSAATVDTFDDLSGVADDAVLDTASITAETGLTAVPNAAGDRIDITGTVQPGDTLTVTYQVTVKAYVDQGDHLVRNALACEPGDPQPCDPTSTTNPVRHLTLTKSSDATADSRPGDTVSYTVRLVNDGAGDFSAADPATLVDDLTEVLDDASFDGVAHASAGPAATYAAPRITWAGPLASGDEVRVTYEVVLTGGGDGHVDNVAWVPPDPTDPGPTPDCGDPATSFPCDDEQFDLPKLSITKTAEPAEVNAVGDEVTYTVIVKNEGPGDYAAGAPATFSDDLSKVLDDATYVVGSETADVGTPSFATPTLSWTGELASGDDATVTYKVRYTGAGDQSLENAACVPELEAIDPAAPCDTVITTGSKLTQTKTTDPADGASVDVGDEITYTLTFTNDGDAPARIDTTDDLSDVIDDGDIVTGPTAQTPLIVDEVGDELVITGLVPAGVSRTVTYTVEVTAPDTGNGVLLNTLACQPGEPATCEPETTEHAVRGLKVAKSSNATADTRPGDTVTYEITAENTGAGDYTAAEPAVVVDDLTSVLDDAVYNDDATADVGDDPAYAAPRITWSGALDSGDTVTITYTVKLKAGGNGVVRNVAWGPDPSDPPGPTPDCDDPAVTVPCAEEEYELPRLSITKAASRTELPAVGQTVTYTVTVKNEGPGDYTGAAPATFSDDLSDVLDDAAFVDGSITSPEGTASLTGQTLTWSGVLVSGDDATVTYTVRYTGAGDKSLLNEACVPDDEAVDPTTACMTVSVPGSGLAQTKTSTPASGTPVSAGDTIVYTLTFTNTGPAAATVDTYDELSGVLDDADLTAGPTAETGLTATQAGTRINVTGAVPTGETLTVTYTVTVEPYTDQGDHVLRNSLACQPGDPVSCVPETTEHPIGHLTVTKTSDAKSGIDTGDKVTYTITVLNDGVTVQDPAVVLDDLSDVLDDATFGTHSADRGTVSFVAPTLTWQGRLEPGQQATITYSVTVTNQGDHDLGNIAAVLGCDEPGCNPPPVVTDLPYVVPAKTTDPKSGAAVQAGDIVKYTLSWTNNGKAPGVVDATDDLSGVLDDANVTVEPVSSSAAVTATRTGNLLRVVGPIAVGQTVTVTYEVTVKAAGTTGDNLVGNVLKPDTPQVVCTAAGVCTPVNPPITEHPIGQLEDWKTVDPLTGGEVTVGDSVTYTLHFKNTGAGDVRVDREDDLSGVLDDARLISGPTSSHPALTVTNVVGGRISITGTLAPGQTVTVTYTVRVLPEERRGDHNLGNFLLDPDEEPPASCKSGTASRGDCTENPASNIDGTKSVSGAGGSKVEPGDRLKYTLTFTNTGKRRDKVNYVDHLGNVLDDAKLVSGPTSSAAALKATRKGQRIRVKGKLSPGQTVTVTYQVEVKNHGRQGNHRLVNFLAPAGDELPSRCPAASDTCTTNGTSPADVVDTPPGTSPGNDNLPDTGAAVGIGMIVAALLALLAGLTLVVTGRRRGHRGEAG